MGAVLRALVALPAFLGLAAFCLVVGGGMGKA
jgi:hypothetical protein